MATTATERPLLIDGEWVETGEWVEVRSPYDGSLVSRVAKGGAAETRRAVDAAERAMSEPLPAHRRAEILVRVAGALGRRADEAAQLISAEAGKPLKAARVEVARAMSTYTMAAVQARTLTGQACARRLIAVRIAKTIDTRAAQRRKAPTRTYGPRCRIVARAPS